LKGESKENMNIVKERLIDIFGKENVLVKPDALASYSKNEGFIAGIQPEYIVRAQNANQVAAVVKWANETGTPLVPVSSGGKHRKGGAVPSVPQAVMVDMSGMNKIYSINKVFRMVVLEPGVTYAELQEALKKEGLMLDTSLAPRAEKSAITSVLESDPRLNPNMQWASSDPLRCTEVVWGDGTLMRTGELAASAPNLPGPEAVAAEQANHSWQSSQNGPELVDFYRLLTSAQGTMGIVTLASLKCAILPEIHNMHLMPSDDLNKIIDFMYNMVHLRFGDSLFMMNGFAFASLMGKTPEDIKALQKEMPAWIGFASAASRPPLPEKRVYAHETGIVKCAQKAGVQALSGLGGFAAKDVLERAFTQCSGKYWKDTFKGSAAEIFFLSTMDKVPFFVNKMYELAAREGYSATDIGVYVQPKHQGVNCHLEFILPYNSESAKEVSMTRTLFEKASRAFSDMGAYYSRPYGVWSRMQINKDAVAEDTLKKLKGIFDPNHILNPGKLTV